jgi:phenylacetate-CoA ligase
MTMFYDALEQRDPGERETQLLLALSQQIANAKQNSDYFARHLADVDPQSITTREALAELPVTRKSDLNQLQSAALPFGGMLTKPVADMARVFASPGPIFEPESHVPDYWRIARALFAAGVRRGELVHNTFSYHFSPAGSMLETAAHALGCPVFPAGVGQTELQVEAMHSLRPSVYVGTPSFLNIILGKADELGVDVSAVNKALVSAEPLPASLRSGFGDRGIHVRQAYVTADLGLLAYESESMEGLILDEGVVLELLRPGTGDPVAEGEVGEVTITTLNSEYPLIRFATGDLSAIEPGMSPCGRTNVRIKGWMGRADQTTKVRGMFVHPAMVDKIVKRYPQVVKARLVVGNSDNRDSMVLNCEVSEGNAELSVSIAEAIRDVTKLRGEVEFVATGSLVNDGKVIDDIRTYE